MKCPSCAADVQWVGKFGVCSEHGQVAMREEPAPLAPIQGSLSQRILERYPFAIAHGYQRTIAPESAAAAYSNFFFTYEATLQFVTLLLLAEFLQSERQVPELAMKLVNLRRPDLGKWTEAMFSLAKYWKGEHPIGALAHTARSFAKLSHDGRSLQDAVRNLRNTEMHYKSWTEPHCREQLARWVPALERTLEHFACLTDYEVWRKTEGGAVRLVGANNRFETQPVHDAQLAEVLAISDLAVRLPAGELLPLRPLFVASDQLPQGYSEPLLAFFGHTKAEVVYLGVSSEARRREELTRYEQLLSAKNIDPRFTVADFEPWTVSDWARESARVVLESLRGVKYFPDQYQCRRRGATQAEGAEPSPGVDDVFDQWLAGGREAALIVAAEAGSGKTSLLCRAAEELAQADGHDCVLLLTGGTLRATGHGSLFARIRDGLGFSDDATGGGLLRFDQLLERWISIGEQDEHYLARRLVLLIDAVNEAADPKSVLEEVAALAESAASANRRAGRPFVRLIVSLRAERVRTLSERWGEQSDTPFLPNAHNFAHFEDGRGKREPFLALRRFSLAEAEQAYALAQERSSAPCTVPWTALNTGTRDLVRHPLMLMLFHRAYAGATSPPALDGEQPLWAAWLDRVFDPMQSSPGLEKRALDLADGCIDRGATVIPEELIDEWHAAWRKELNHDPARIAASLDWLERLTEWGLLRQQENGQLDWVSEAVAEQLYFRALRRRDPEMRATSVEEWLRLPTTRRLLGALVLLGAAAWGTGNLSALEAVITTRPLSVARHLGARVVLVVAPGGAAFEVRSELAGFESMLSALVARVVRRGAATPQVTLRHILLYEVYDALADRWGAYGTLLAISAQGQVVAAALAQLDPNDMAAQLDLAVSYDRLGKLAERTDSDAARDWYERALVIRERLGKLEPSDVDYSRHLSASYFHIGNLTARTDEEAARTWVERGLAIVEHLAQLDPTNATYQRDLSVSYYQLSSLTERTDADAARTWAERALVAAERLVHLESTNEEYQRGVAVCYSQLGTLTESTNADAARRWHEKGLTIWARLALLEPGNAAYQRGLSLSYGGLGNLSRRTDSDAARDWYERALGIAERLAMLEPSNLLYQHDIAVCCSQFGDLTEATFANEARSWYERALGIAERLALLEPSNLTYQHDIAIACSQLGDLAESTDPDRARDCHERAWGIIERLAMLVPSNLTYQHQLSISCLRLGELTEHTNADAARSWYERGFVIAERLSRLEPSNVIYRADLFVLWQAVGPVKEHMSPDAEHAWYERGLVIAEGLAQLEPSNTTYQNFHFSVCKKVATLAERTDNEAARRWYARSLVVRERMAQLEQSNVIYLRDLFMLCDKLATLAESTDTVAARDWYERGVVFADRLARLEPNNMQHQGVLAVACNQLGVLTGRSHPVAARGWFERALVIAERLAQLEPSNIPYQHAVVTACRNLESLAEGAHADAGRDWLERGLVFSERLAQLEPSNATHQSALARSYHRLAKLLEGQDTDAACHWYERGLVIAERLAQLKPTNVIYQRDSFMLCAGLGALLQETNAAAARGCYERMLLIAERLTQMEPNNAAHQRLLSNSYDMLEHSYECELVEATHRANREPTNVACQWELATSYSRLGKLTERTDPVAARDWYERGLAIAERLAQSEPDNISYQRDLAHSYANLGRATLPFDRVAAVRWLERARSILVILKDRPATPG